MLEANARDFVAAINLITQFSAPERLALTGEGVIEQSAISFLRPHLSQLRVHLEAMEMQAALNSLSRLEKITSSGHIELASYLSLFAEMKGRIFAELDGRKAIWLNAFEARHFNSEDPIFGSDVDEKFPEARFDIEEAAKCLALGLNVGAIFHMMRATEAVAMRFARRLRAKTKTANGENETLGGLVNNTQAKIAKIKNRKRRDEYLKMHMYFQSANRAYRTKTAHPLAKYTDKEAREAFAATRSFFMHLAELF